MSKKIKRKVDICKHCEFYKEWLRFYKCNLDGDIDLICWTKEKFEDIVINEDCVMTMEYIVMGQMNEKKI